ncbi:Sodium-coupled monocarboxylate transporter 2, partial [Armadillidium vulgare]
MRAVVWTDSFQFVAMMIGILITSSLELFNREDWKMFFLLVKKDRDSNSSKLVYCNAMNPSLYERHNFYNTIAFGAFYYGSLFSISQINVQRISSVKTLKDGKMVLIYTMIGFFILHILIFSGGIVVYASYEGCDPVLEGKIKSYNQLLSFFIMNKLNIIGFAGIFSATLLASTL